MTENFDFDFKSVLEAVEDPNGNPKGATELEGQQTDADGNLIDKDGNIIEQEDSDDSSETIEYSLDNDGNLVDNKGSIVKEKGKFKLAEDGSVIFDEEPLINSLASLAKERGILPEGEEIDLPDTEEGYFELALKLGKTHAQKALDELLGSSPEIKGLIAHLNSGRPAAEFYESRLNTSKIHTYDKVPEDMDGKIDLIKQSLKTINKMDDKEILELIGFYEASSKIDEKAKAALNNLKEYDAELQNQLAEQYEEQLKSEREQIANQTKLIKETIAAGKLGDFALTGESKNKFADYVLKPVQNGSSQAAIDYDKLPLDKKLLLDYFMYTGMDINKLVEIKVKQAEAERLRSKIKSGVTRVVIKTTNAPAKQGVELSNEII